MAKKRYNRIDEDTGEIGKQIFVYDDENDTLKMRTYSKRNYMVKEYPDGKKEVIYFPKCFMISNDVLCDPDLVCDLEHFREIDPNIGMRKWQLGEDGVLVPAEGRDGSVTDLIRQTMRSGKRAIVSFYEYALANRWEYFTDFTFDNANINQISECWKNFRKSMKYKYPDFKALAVVEAGEITKRLHLHALVSNCDFTLIPARNNKLESDYYGNFFFDRCGNQIFNIADWKYGFSTTACIPPTDNQTVVVNYCTKYLSKFKSVGYNANKYYHTQNLESCKIVMGMSENFSQINELILNYGLDSKKTLKDGSQCFSNFGKK